MAAARAATPSKKRAPDGKVHVHIDNSSALHEVFEASRKRVRQALDKHSDLKDKLRVTISYDGEGIERQLRTAEVLYGWDFEREDMAARAPRLRLVMANGAGVNHFMPLDWLPRTAVFTNARGVHGERAAEYAIMAVLMLNNRLPEMVTHQRRGTWVQCFNSAIGGKTLLIIGVGNVGGSAARWAKRFGLKVWGVRRTRRPHRHVDEMYGPEDLPRILPKADFVLMTTPETERSRHLLGRKELDRMKKGAGIVNYSRAGVIDYEHLAKKCERGELIAILDVFEPEPLPDSSYLWDVPNLIITPHCSSDDLDLYSLKTLDVLFDNVRRYLDGRPPRNRVSRTHQY